LLTQANNNELREMVEADPSQTTQELMAWFNVTLATILTHLHQINKMEKYEKWVPHDLTDLQKETRIETSVAFLNRYGNEGILD
jgi:[histone H3]-lysine36 N-dimethyltransferase SETMAR